MINVVVHQVSLFWKPIITALSQKMKDTIGFHQHHSKKYGVRLQNSLPAPATRIAINTEYTSHHILYNTFVVWKCQIFWPQKLIFVHSIYPKKTFCLAIIVLIVWKETLVYRMLCSPPFALSTNTGAANEIKQWNNILYVLVKHYCCSPELVPKCFFF